MLDQVVKALKQAFWVSPVIKSCVSSRFVLCSTEENKKVLKEQALSKFKPYIWESVIREILIFLPICTRNFGTYFWRCLHWCHSRERGSNSAGTVTVADGVELSMSETNSTTRTWPLSKDHIKKNSKNEHQKQTKSKQTTELSTN